MPNRGRNEERTQDEASTTMGKKEKTINMCSTRVIERIHEILNEIDGDYAYLIKRLPAHDMWDRALSNKSWWLVGKRERYVEVVVLEKEKIDEGNPTESKYTEASLRHQEHKTLSQDAYDMMRKYIHDENINDSQKIICGGYEFMPDELFYFFINDVKYEGGKPLVPEERALEQHDEGEYIYALRGLITTLPESAQACLNPLVYQE